MSERDHTDADVMYGATPGGDGCYCTHHPDDPAHGRECYPPEVWQRDLRESGWIAESATAWRAPDGSLWRGPFGAWKELQRRLDADDDYASTPHPSAYYEVSNE